MTPNEESQEWVDRWRQTFSFHSLFDTWNGWVVSIRLFGWADCGIRDVAAAHAEERRPYPNLRWDRKAHDLQYEVILIEDAVHEVPDWFALPWVSEAIARGRLRHPFNP